VDWDGEKAWVGYEFPAKYCPFCTGKQRSPYDQGFEVGFKEACKALIPPGSGSDSFNDFEKLHQITPEIAKAVASTKAALSFSGLRPLPHESWEDCFSVEASAPFSTFKGDFLDLSTLEKTGEKQLKNLSTCGDLNLAGLTLLPGESALVLGNHKGMLTLGLENLSAKDGEGLSKKKGGLRLLELKVLDPKVARLFEGFEGCLDLGIISISPKTATSLSKIKGNSLNLGRLKEIDSSSAHELGSYQGSLSLGLKKINDSSAEGLGRGNGSLSLDSLESLSEVSASHLIKRSGTLGFGGLRNICLNVAKLLAQNKGELNLGGLESISEDIGLELSKHTYTLRLYGLVDLSDKTVAFLAKHRVKTSDGLLFLSLPNPRQSSFELLSRHEGNLVLGIGPRPFTFRVEDSSTIEPNEAEWLARHKGKVTVRWVDALKPSAIKILKDCPTIEGIDYDSVGILKEDSKQIERRKA